MKFNQHCQTKISYLFVAEKLYQKAFVIIEKSVLCRDTNSSLPEHLGVLSGI